MEAKNGLTVYNQGLPLRFMSDSFPWEGVPDTKPYTYDKVYNLLTEGK